MLFKSNAFTLALLLTAAGAVVADAPLRLHDYALSALSPKDCFAQSRALACGAPSSALVFENKVQYAISSPQPVNAKRCDERFNGARGVFSEPSSLRLTKQDSSS